MDPLSLLLRDDKWFLGGGKGALYAPAFPRHLEAPGFWDESFFADIRLTRIFTVLFNSTDGKCVKFRGQVESWRPDRLVLIHRSSIATVRETRCVTESNAWVSVFELLEGAEDLNAFVWSLQNLEPAGNGSPWQSVQSVKVESECISWRWLTSWPVELEPDRTGIEDERTQAQSGRMLPPLPLSIKLGASGQRLGYTVNLAQRHDDSPAWETSVLPQKLKGGRLPGDFKFEVGTAPSEGLLHMLQHFRLTKDQPLIVACAVGLNDLSATEGLRCGLASDVVAQSERSWVDYFNSVPQFESSNAHLTNAYWYRWYGLRLNTVDLDGLPIAGTNQTFEPFITEGIGFFRNFVTYSAQAHLREVAWMHSPRLGLGIVSNLLKCQKADGMTPGHNYSCRPSRDFYHADFATGAALLMDIHGVRLDRRFFTNYLDFLVRKRGYRFPAPSPGQRVSPLLILIFDQNETGQEYMSRYQFVSENADKWGSFQVAGVESTLYAERLTSFLLNLSPTAEESSVLHRLYEELVCGLAEVSFDRGTNWFSDVKLDGARSPARPSTGLYPLLGPAHLLWHNYRVDLGAVFDRWLVNAEEFWLRAFPATAKSDPLFDGDGEWKGKRLNCSWSGRSWPMANSHLVDAAAQWARVLTRDREEMTENQSMAARIRAGKALMKTISLMFHGDDPNRPNSYEHYDPESGVPSLYRGYDDYMHSWIVDLILRHAVGINPGSETLDPLPLGVDWIECREIPCKQGRRHVRIERDVVVRDEYTSCP
ncbi:MAG: hypothetical protein BGO01_06635 [Armatimonadetes bacterium 55-13]|nr:MAG: hypothetical protein BGO01_06635 [Armatimonadetes bacterium 55-13]